MATIRGQYAGGNLEFEEFWKITGTFEISQFPNRPCALVRFKAFSTNAGSVFIGNVYNTGSVLSMPFELDAGDDTGWICTDNINRYYHAGSSGSSYIAVWLQK